MRTIPTRTARALLLPLALLAAAGCSGGPKPGDTYRYDGESLIYTDADTFERERLRVASGAELDPQTYAKFRAEEKAFQFTKGVKIRVAEPVKGGAKIFGLRDGKASETPFWVLDSALRPDLKE
jgi:hypothetical protein